MLKNRDETIHLSLEQVKSASELSFQSSHQEVCLEFKNIIVDALTP